MRRIAAFLCSFVLVAACQGAGAEVHDQGGSPPTTAFSAEGREAFATPKATTARPSTTVAGPPAVADLPDGTSLVLAARDSVEVYAQPGEAEPFRVLEPTTILGTTTVLTVLEGPVDGWARVMLPGRPNGAEGWVRSDELDYYMVEGRLTVDLSDRRLTLEVDGTQRLSTDVAVGGERNPTPIGRFYVTDNVTLADPNGPWGPHALGLSARSETITEFNGGDGIIGIHGTNQPSSIGRAASLGCVRTPNEVITLLHQLVDVGTPVEITA